MWFWLALIAMLCWSGSDLFSKIGSRPDDKQSHWKMVMAVGLVMGLHAMYEILVNGVAISWEVIWRYMPASALYILSMILGYVGLRYIELSISTPICNTSGAIAALILLLGPVVLPKVFTFRSYDNLMILIPILLMAAGVVMLGFVETNEDEAVKAERRKRENIQYVASVLALLLPVLYCLIDAAGTAADAIILNPDTGYALRMDVVEEEDSLALVPRAGSTGIYVIKDAEGNETEAVPLSGDMGEYGIYDGEGGLLATVSAGEEGSYAVLDGEGEALYTVDQVEGESPYYAPLDEEGEEAEYIVLNPHALDEDSANVAYELTFLFMGVCAAIYVLIVKREKLTVKREAPKLLAGIFETAGQFAYIYAIAANAVGAAPIISCYCLVSVLWSRIFLKEKLSWKHYAAIALAGVGIAIMGIFDP